MQVVSGLGAGAGHREGHSTRSLMVRSVKGNPPGNPSGTHAGQGAGCAAAAPQVLLESQDIRSDWLLLDSVGREAARQVAAGCTERARVIVKVGCWLSHSRCNT